MSRIAVGRLHELMHFCPRGSLVLLSGRPARCLCRQVYSAIVAALSRYAATQEQRDGYVTWKEQAAERAIGHRCSLGESQKACGMMFDACFCAPEKVFGIDIGQRSRGRAPAVLCFSFHLPHCCALFAFHCPFWSTFVHCDGFFTGHP